MCIKDNTYIFLSTGTCVIFISANDTLNVLFTTDIIRKNCTDNLFFVQLKQILLSLNKICKICVYVRLCEFIEASASKGIWSMISGQEFVVDWRAFLEFYIFFCLNNMLIFYIFQISKFLCIIYANSLKISTGNIN